MDGRLLPFKKGAFRVAIEQQLPVLPVTLVGTREIMLIHHTDCGMLTFKDDELKQQIQDETGIKPRFAMEAFDDLDTDVRQGIARIKASPSIPHRDQVRGFVADVESGKLREVD